MLGIVGFMVTGLVCLSPAVTAQPPAQKGKAGGQPKGTSKGKDAASLTPNQSAPPKGFDEAKADTARGKVETVELKAKSDGGTYKISVYTPPGYKPSEKYPVMYLLHGRSGDETTWTKDIRAAAILDNLYADKKAVPMIVVMPSNSSAETRAKGPVSPMAAMAFNDVLRADVVPFIESKYPAKAGRENRAVAGLSMGAGQAFAVGLGHADEFAWVGAFSGAGRRITPPSKELRLLWLSVGDKDAVTGTGVQEAEAALTDKKIPHVFRVNTGGHEPSVWRTDLYHFAPKLFQKPSGEK
ncbi:alpha/beta hydrolase [Limnoglobus roseus]|uniref:alpha/beta hydrolase n=1 Tax=Limnoglobus roseus TaxID=2598579 RepID=UPI0011EAD825|nr:alpha/beta hydrolase-fold protein [Limnoglobus roseus]